MIITVATLSINLFGCQTFRQAKVEIVNEDTKNVEMCIEVARKLKETWLFKSALIRAAINIAQLPLETVQAMDQCDELAAKEELTDYELGCFLGSLIRIINSVGMQVLQQYAPEVLELLPPVL